LIVGRSTRLPDPNHPTAKDVATRVGFESADDLQQTLTNQMEAIRAAYNRLLATDERG